MASEASQQKQIVDLASLTTQQLSTVKKQLDDELEHLTTSYTKLLAAQSRFRECLKSVKQGVSSNVMGSRAPSYRRTKAKLLGTPILIPITSSLYVPGSLADADKVVVDVGTGFYVEKSTEDAISFYVGKVDNLTINLKDLESIVQGKSNNLHVIEDALRQKMARASDVSPIN